jgi:hypothetical protein
LKVGSLKGDLMFDEFAVEVPVIAVVAAGEPNGGMNASRRGNPSCELSYALELAAIVLAGFLKLDALVSSGSFGFTGVLN